MSASMFYLPILILAAGDVSSAPEIYSLKTKTSINLFFSCMQSQSLLLQSAGETADETSKAAYNECARSRAKAASDIYSDIQNDISVPSQKQQFEQFQMFMAIMDSQALNDAKISVMKTRAKARVK